MSLQDSPHSTKGGLPSVDLRGKPPDDRQHENEPVNCKTVCSTTIGYYNENADEFAASTANVEFSAMQEKFASLLVPGASVLDFGCGSGRDSKSFIDRGFRVTATDGSSALCRIASRLTGLEVRNELFQDLSDVAAYDGIWACSSILHLPKSELIRVLPKMLRALKPGGVIYTSFKYGLFEGYRNGRHFTDFTEESFREFISEIEGVEIIEQWVSRDMRPRRGDEKWLNLLLGKS